MNVSRLIRIMEMFVSDHQYGVALGITEKGEMPEYYVDKGDLPAICRLSEERKEVSSVCRAFYSKLTGVEPTCPFGVVMRRHDMDNRHGTISVYFLLSSRFVTSASDIAAKFKDPLRQEVVKALRELKNHKFETEFRQIVSELEDISSSMDSDPTSDSVVAVAHEMLTPVQGLMADVDAMGIDANSKIKSNLNLIENYAKSLSLMITKSLVYNNNQVQKTFIYKIIHDVLVRHESYSISKNVEINLDIQSRHHIYAYRDHIDLALSAVIHNAIKYSFEGSEYDPFVVDIRVAEEKDRYARGYYQSVRVSNSGVLIAEDEHDKIFKMGYRGRYSGDRDRAGSGVGLYVAHKIVTAHGGSITVSSTVVDRTTVNNDPIARTSFEIRLPVSPI